VEIDPDDYVHYRREILPHTPEDKIIIKLPLDGAGGCVFLPPFMISNISPCYNRKKTCLILKFRIAGKNQLITTISYKSMLRFLQYLFKAGDIRKTTIPCLLHPLTCKEEEDNIEKIHNRISKRYEILDFK
jgi:hypothetical protein